jgi:hypothetical protein
LRRRRYAWAKPRQAVEARLDRLEAEVSGLRGDLSAPRKAENEQPKPAPSRPRRAQAAEAQASDRQQTARRARSQACRGPAAAPASADGFKSASAPRSRSAAIIKLIASSSRYSDGEVATNSLGRDFYLPQTIPTGAAPASRVTRISPPSNRASG